jgi:hypothetical protein
MNDLETRVNGWVFDPAREVWWARVSDSRWLEIHAAFDDAPGFRPSAVA